MISVCFQGKPFNITVIQVYAPTSNAEEAKVDQFYKDLLRTSRTNTQKRCLFHFQGLEGKSRKSRNTWSKGKFGLGVQNEAGQRLIQFFQENAVLPRDAERSYQTPSSNNTRDNSTHGHHQMVDTEIILIIFSAAEDGKFYTVSKNKTGS